MTENLPYITTMVPHPFPITLIKGVAVTVTVADKKL